MTRINMQGGDNPVASSFGEAYYARRIFTHLHTSRITGAFRLK